MLLNIARWLLWQIAEPARPITHGPPANITIFDGRARADRSAGAPDGAS